MDIYKLIYIVIIISFSFMLLRAKWSTFVLLYIVLFPMGNIFPEEAILIKGLGVVEALSLFLILKYLLTFKSILKPPTRIHKLAISLTFFFVVIYLGTFYIKHYSLYGLGGVSLTTLIIRVFKLILLFYSIRFIIITSNIPSVFKQIKNGLIFSIVFYSGMVFLSDILLQTDLSIVPGTTMDSSKTLTYWGKRNVGMFSGDSQYFSHYMVVGFGFVLALYERKKQLNYLFISALILSAIIYTASRSGVITFFIIIIFYTLKNTKRNFFSTFIIFLLMISVLYTLGDFLLERIILLITNVSTGDTNRQVFQLFYLNEMYENPSIFLTGYLQKSSLFRWRVPHNQYFGMVFWGGIPYLLIFLTILLKIYKNSIKSLKNTKDSLSGLYPFLGFVIPYLFNPNEFVIYFTLILSISYKYSNITRHSLK